MRKFLIPIALLFLVGFVNAQPILDFDNPQISETDIVQQLQDAEVNIQSPSPAQEQEGKFESRLIQITETGEEIEVSPTVLDGKPYYKFKPNAYFFWKAKCSSQQEGATWNVRINYKFYPNYGGHNHNGSIPPLHYRSGKPVPNPKDYYGLPVNQTFYIRYKGPDFASRLHHDTHVSGACEGDTYAIIDFKIDGLELLKPAWTDSLHGGVTYYSLIAYPSPYHPISYFGKPQTISLLKQIAWEYYFEFGHPIGINDLSLRWGGLYDIGPIETCPGCQFWKPPHTFHRYGRQADVRMWSIPVGNRERFKQICCELGVEPQEHKDNRPLNSFESSVWENIDFSSPPWNSFSEKELDMRTPHYHLVFPKFDTEIDDPPDQIPQGCPSSR